MRTVRSTITPQQRRILRFIVAYQQRHGYPPSVREIGTSVGLASSSTVHWHLHALERLGYLKRDPNKPRALRILNPTS